MALKTANVKLNDAGVKRIYLDAFPKEERMPFSMMVAMSKLWNTNFWAFYDKDVLCGFVYMAVNRNLAFLMFLAVDEALRSQGYGSAILQEISKKYPNKKIIVSIEPYDNSASDLKIRKMRKSFYLKNGYQETGYKIKLSGVVQDIIIKNGEFSKKEFRSFFAVYSNGAMWPQIWKPAL